MVDPEAGVQASSEEPKKDAMQTDRAKKTKGADSGATSTRKTTQKGNRRFTPHSPFRYRPAPRMMDGRRRA